MTTLVNICHQADRANMTALCHCNRKLWKYVNSKPKIVWLKRQIEIYNVWQMKMHLRKKSKWNICLRINNIEICKCQKCLSNVLVFTLQVPAIANNVSRSHSLFGKLTVIFIYKARRKNIKLILALQAPIILKWWHDVQEAWLFFRFQVQTRLVC